MPKPNVIYNCQGLFVGPAPETGYNFVHYTGGAPTNDHSDLYQKVNLLHPIDRVQSVSYSINVPHTNVTQLNQRGLVDRPIINFLILIIRNFLIFCFLKLFLVNLTKVRS